MSENHHDFISNIAGFTCVNYDHHGCGMSSRHLKVSNVFDSLITARNSFQIVAAEKLKERLLKIVVQK